MKTLFFLPFFLISTFCTLSCYSQDLKGQVYIIRTNIKSEGVYDGYVIAGEGKMQVFIDNELVCKISNKSYCVLSVTPGLHKFGLNNKSNYVEIEIQSGKTYYLHILIANPTGLSYDRPVYFQEILESSYKNLIRNLKLQTDLL